MSLWGELQAGRLTNSEADRRQRRLVGDKLVALCQALSFVGDRLAARGVLLHLQEHARSSNAAHEEAMFHANAYADAMERAASFVNQ